MPLTKRPPNLDGTSDSRSKVRTRPHTASGSYSKPPTFDKSESVAYSNTSAAKPPTPLSSPTSSAKTQQNDGPYWLSGIKSPGRRRRPRTQGETTWERRAREYEENEAARREQWLAERREMSENGNGNARDMETYMDGDGFIHNPLARTDTREPDGHVLAKARTLDANERRTEGSNGFLKADGEMSTSRRRPVESGLWEIGSKEPSELSGSSDSDSDDQNDVISFTTDAEEQQKDREEFSPLATPLLNSRLDFMNEVSFSNRGSVLLSGKKALEVKKERERIMARANRRSFQQIDSEDAPISESAAQLETTGDGATQSLPEPAAAAVPLPLSPPEEGATKTIEATLTPKPTRDSPQTPEPVREAPPTPEPTREAPEIPASDIPQRALTQHVPRVRQIGEDPEVERPSSSPRPATPTQRPQSSPEPSRLGISANPLSALIQSSANIEPEPLLVKQLEARPRMPAQRHTMPKSPIIKTLSQEIEAESLKVRSMYEAGSADTEDWRTRSLVPPSDAYIPRTSPVEESNNEDVFSTSMATRSDSTLRQRPHTAYPSSSVKRESVLRKKNELAGGIEDWEGVPSERVDRYGFIVEPPSPSASQRKGSLEMMAPPPPPQRVSTALQLASEAPRQGIFGRRPSVSGQSVRKGRVVDPKSSSRSLRTQATGDSAHRSPARTSRAIINRLPGMSERRIMDEAGDMLTLPHGLLPTQEPSPAVIEQRKRTETRRAEKWRKMARVVRSPTPSTSTNRDGSRSTEATAEPGKGGGMHFTFNTQDPKLISRVWKGIPDRWRATAWHSFLATSAKKHPGSATDEELGEAFRQLVDCSSADDVQIDMDVPRTINSHIMFRSRYRGGQRLLFRVLHCLSLYFPETGYVQGMASLAATLLCYFEEEGAFCVAVRMWELRGLKKLYAPGFEGLMSALDEFREEWLMKGNLEVSKQLDEMGIHPTAYGTRWYLTLFNYSVPFETQLRVWDLFMLLGDETPCPPGHRHTSLASTPHHGIGSRPSSAETAGGTLSSRQGGSTSNGPGSHQGGSANGEPRRQGFHGQLDILHAAGCAIVDGTRTILLEGDFENVMKNLTSWVPVKDEELFVRVVRAEWRRHGRR